MDVWQQLCTEEGVEVTTEELKEELSEEVTAGLYTELQRLYPEEGESLDVSMVSLSFSPSVRRTQRSRFGSDEEEVSEGSEQNSAVRFLQTLLLTCWEVGS